ncbi:DUF4234 domain-containing protein [Nocardioides sp.]|uniref:DUF4234 domain-containing protein n=1 Tax=Nocardioides sp. TaxID=35761 RepID=UPI002626E12F|nr:DUF4234 domain-containing protein [Nocardioides sp.]
MTDPYAFSPAGQLPPSGPIGKPRDTLVVILLAVITCGIYSWYWFYATSEEMKRHTGQGLGGVLSLILAFFISPVAAFITSNEIAQMYERAGRKAPVSVLNGLWYFPGCFILIGPLVWIIQINGALNGYWRSLGAA